jgi:hypothetical protein
LAAKRFQFRSQYLFATGWFHLIGFEIPTDMALELAGRVGFEAAARINWGEQDFRQFTLSSLNTMSMGTSMLLISSLLSEHAGQRVFVVSEQEDCEVVGSYHSSRWYVVCQLEKAKDGSAQMEVVEPVIGSNDGMERVRDLLGCTAQLQSYTRYMPDLWCPKDIMIE